MHVDVVALFRLARAFDRRRNVDLEAGRGREGGEGGEEDDGKYGTEGELEE